jgi:hypothetical protein
MNTIIARFYRRKLGHLEHLCATSILTSRKFLIGCKHESPFKIQELENCIVIVFKFYIDINCNHLYEDTSTVSSKASPPQSGIKYFCQFRLPVLCLKHVLEGSSYAVCDLPSFYTMTIIYDICALHL